jgi:hypothetical protein
MVTVGSALFVWVSAARGRGEFRQGVPEVVDPKPAPVKEGKHKVQSAS